KAAYAWLERWLAGREKSADEFPVTPRPSEELLICEGGQVNTAFKSRHLLPLALDQFRAQSKIEQVNRLLWTLLKPSYSDSPDYHETVFDPEGETDNGTILFINGNQAVDWRQ